MPKYHRSVRRLIVHTVPLLISRGFRIGVNASGFCQPAAIKQVAPAQHHDGDHYHSKSVYFYIPPFILPQKQGQIAIKNFVSLNSKETKSKTTRYHSRCGKTPPLFQAQTSPAPITVGFRSTLSRLPPPGRDNGSPAIHPAFGMPGCLFLLQAAVQLSTSQLVKRE